MTYKIKFSAQFDEDFSKLEKRIQGGCLKKVKILSAYPYYGKALVGKLKGLWELKLGKYRIIYTISMREKVIRMAAIGLRKGVFKRVERLTAG